MMNTPLSLGGTKLRNRLYRAPVLEGAGDSADPAKTYLRAFLPNARAGVGLVVQGNTVVTPRGRTSPGMCGVRDAEDVLRLRTMTEAVRAEGAAVVLQLGHGGIFSLESWHSDYQDELAWSPSPLPWWLRAFHPGVHVLTTDELAALVDRFGVVARWAKDAGYDGVQLAGCNAKLLHQLLSRSWNTRGDRYGGSAENRARILVEIRRAIGRTCGEDFPVLLKYCARESGWNPGITLDEGLEIARIAEAAGFAALTPAGSSAFPDTGLCKGDFPEQSFRTPGLRKRLVAASNETHVVGLEASMRLAAWKHPYRPVWNRDVFRAVKAEVDVPVFAVGGIRTPQEAAQILADGDADMVGLGRPFYTEPELPRWFLAEADRAVSCGRCNRCVVPQMLGMPGRCYRPEAAA